LNDTATTEIYTHNDTLSLHDALPIWTVWHIAAKNGRIEVLNKLSEWAKEVLTQEELKNMILAHDAFKNADWPIAAEMGQIEVLSKLKELAKEVLTQDE
jgi:hypothetical protein